MNSIGMELTLIPVGTFLMGSPEDETGRMDDEGPQIRVTLTRPFYLGIYPVTQRQYLDVTGHNPSHHGEQAGRFRGDYPVDQIDWDNAVAAICPRCQNALPFVRSVDRLSDSPRRAAVVSEPSVAAM